MDWVQTGLTALTLVVTLACWAHLKRLRVLAVLPAMVALCAVEIVRRGFGAPVLYGCRLWAAAMRRDASNDEDDWPV